ncbi:alpha-(1,3)-fucosyltransferase C [Caerostris extrusa]|uniref:Alpha-(1,3)-fucosyltransferase C n=1 Tax=Caerostris extrusa TaxID=172846 RepID=A0AAV4RBP3_CAEEX|nr:alpha-(1,3)-fucosyltransferase C [Caerostris extrusa]
MTNHIISQILRHPVYFLAITLSATTCYLLIMVNYIFILTVTRLRIPQNDTSVKVKNFYSGTSRTFEIHSKIPGRARASNNTKLILLWNPLFTGMEFLQEGHKSFNHSSCSESRCEIISDRNRLAESNAILFHLRTFSLLDIPRRRSSNQKWIFFSLEAPPYSNFPGLSFMHDMFNWTMTYRNDSDVVMTYGRSARNIKSSFYGKGCLFFVEEEDKNGRLDGESLPYT